MKVDSYHEITLRPNHQIIFCDHLFSGERPSMLHHQFRQIWHKICHYRFSSIGVLLLLIALATYKILNLFSNNTTPPEAKVVEVEIAVLSNLTSTTRFIGTIRAQHSTTLISKAMGTLDVLLNAGQWVKKGTLIAKIDNADIEKAYELSVSSEKIAHDQYQRVETLQKSGTSSKSAVEERKNAWISAQKALTETKISRDKLHFYAPFDGVIGVFKVHEGAQVQEGDPIVSFYDMASLIVEFGIPATILPKIQNQQLALINGQEYPLTHVQRMIDEETHMCPAYIDYPCKDCLIGTTLDVDLVIAQHKGVIVLPVESIVIKDDHYFVYIVKNGRAVLTPVELGLREKDKIEIISGVTVGDQVIITGQTRLHPDADVTIHQEKTDKKV